MTDFNVVAELDQPADAPDDDVDTLMDTLAAFHPAIGTSQFNRLEAVITVQAETISQATALAAAIFRDNTLASVQVMATDDFDRLHGLVPIPDLLSVSEAADLLHVSRTRVQQLIDGSKLPACRVGRAWAIPASAVPAAGALAETVK